MSAYVYSFCGVLEDAVSTQTVSRLVVERIMREDLEIIGKGSRPSGRNIAAFRWMERRKQRKTSRGSKVVASLILNLDTRWRWVVSQGERCPGTQWREGPMHPKAVGISEKRKSLDVKIWREKTNKMQQLDVYY